MPKEQKHAILKKIGFNMLIAVVIVIYFVFMILGFINIERQTYINDLKVFSLVIIALTIILFDNIICKYNYCYSAYKYNKYILI